MKRVWELEELIGSFSLSVIETSLWNGKDEIGQVGLTVLLKVFQHEGDRTMPPKTRKLWWNILLGNWGSLPSSTRHMTMKDDTQS